MSERDAAPRGIVATIGHPSNGVLIVKGAVGWRYVDSGKLVDDEDFRAGWAPIGPPTQEVQAWRVKSLLGNYATRAEYTPEPRPTWADIVRDLQWAIGHARTYVPPEDRGTPPA